MFSREISSRNEKAILENNPKITTARLQSLLARTWKGFSRKPLEKFNKLVLWKNSLLEVINLPLSKIRMMTWDATILDNPKGFPSKLTHRRHARITTRACQLSPIFHTPTVLLQWENHHDMSICNVSWRIFKSHTTSNGYKFCCL